MAGTKTRKRSLIAVIDQLVLIAIFGACGYVFRKTTAFGYTIPEAFNKLDNFFYGAAIVFSLFIIYDLFFKDAFQP